MQITITEVESVNKKTYTTRLANSEQILRITLETVAHWSRLRVGKSFNRNSIAEVKQSIMSMRVYGLAMLKNLTAINIFIKTSISWCFFTWVIYNRYCTWESYTNSTGGLSDRTDCLGRGGGASIWLP